MQPIIPKMDLHPSLIPGVLRKQDWWERTCLDGYMQYLVRNELSNIWSIYEYRFEQDIQRY